jgi:DNA polymerase III delta prime subunit
VSIQLWVDKYIPHTLEDYVWRDPAMRLKFEEYIRDGGMPHLLLAGRAGLGKTSLAKMMLRMLGVPEGDILIIKASSARGVDEIQTKIMGFVQTYPMIENMNGLKYILLDEADMLSQHAQRFLRSEMETFSPTARFVFTCNYPQKIDPAILSRCQKFLFEAIDMESFIARVGNILDAEKVNYELDQLVDYIESSYPDLRDCIGELQLNVVGGTLQQKPKASKAAQDWIIDAVDLFKRRQHTMARKLIIAQATVDEYPEVFRFLYDNLELFGSTQDQQDDALVIIRDGLYKHGFVANPEINLSATIVELVRLTRS